jgi:hypothetical protein
MSMFTQPDLWGDDPKTVIPTERTCPCCRGTGRVMSGEQIPSAPARPTDPETSHAASKREPDLRRFGEFSHKARLLRVLSREPVTPLTAQEMALAVVGHAAPLSKIEGCRRRVSDLVKVEFIADSGKRAENAGAGTDSILWQITDEGRLAIERLNETGWSL